MSIVQVLADFARDDKLAAALAVVVIDFIFGVMAAVKLRTFSTAYLADFARTDLLGKIVPWFALYAADKVTHGAGILIPGLDLGDVAGATYVVLMAALVGSILASFADLGFSMPAALARGEKPPHVTEASSAR